MCPSHRISERINLRLTPIHLRLDLKYTKQVPIKERNVEKGSTPCT